VKELYPSTSKYAHRSPVPAVSVAPLPAEPTDADPGSYVIGSTGYRLGHGAVRKALPVRVA
jgi:hypothetical protein